VSLISTFAKLNDKLNDKFYYSNLVNQVEEAEKNLTSAPCNTEYSSCSLVEESYKLLNNLGSSFKIREKLEKILEECKKLENEHKLLLNMNIDEQLQQIQELKNNFETLRNNDIPLLSALIEKERIHILSLDNKIALLESKKEEYHINKEKIDSLESKKVEKNRCEEIIKGLGECIQDKEKQLNKLHAEKGALVEKISNLVSERDKLEKMRKDYSAYDLYKKCMHSNGIPFNVIKKKLPVINTEISKILANVVEFEVFFETSDNRLEIYIKHPKHEPRLIETGSGAEKTLAATAIRLALLTVSSLPKGDLFILDEPATELDDETKEGFLRILELIKNYFSKVILISHLEPLKDIVDTEITIEKKNG
jgi:DNA repair exonuclease SbcCD ATPase subunit